MAHSQLHNNPLPSKDIFSFASSVRYPYSRSTAESREDFNFLSILWLSFQW